MSDPGAPRTDDWMRIDGEYRRVHLEVETMLWDGTPERAREIKAWVRTVHADSGFLVQNEMTWVQDHAQLWVAHNHDWAPLPTGHRVVAELDGSGFYPLSPEGLAAGYETTPTGSLR